MNRYYVWLLVALGLIIILIIILSGGTSKSKKTHTITQASLSSLANTNDTVEMITTGPIVAPVNHQVTEINVGPSTTSYNLIKGYDGEVVSSQQFSNTRNSYSAFLSSLDVAGFTKANSNEELASSAGYCSFGVTFDFKIIQANGTVVQNLWATNCPSTPRTYLGNLSQTISLFRSQVPGFSNITQNAGFNI